MIGICPGAAFGPSKRWWPARFAALADTWQDQEHARFADEFRSTMKALARFMENSNQHVPFLLRKAQRIEEYLSQR